MLIESMTSLGVPELVAQLIYAGLVAFMCINFVAVYAGLISVVERRVAAKMQSRVGPNRVGPNGWLQWLADGVKLILKEDLIPAGADRLLFKAAPMIMAVGVAASFAVLPWGPAHAIAADLNVGILYLISISALVVIGILMAGWASNNKWSLLGGMRAAAQIVTYEVPVAMGLLPAIMIAGSLAVSDLVNAQGWAPWDWVAFDNPFAMLGFLLFLTGSVAESNRTPFDLTEAESELVAGYSTEYSGFRFAMFTLGEFANTWVVGAISAAIFLGGGLVPPILANVPGAAVGVFILKTLFMVFVLMWFRWTLPRFRIDQMMDFSWKYMLPLALLAFFGQSIYFLATWDSLVAQSVVSHLMVLIFLGVFFVFINRVLINYRHQATVVNSYKTETDYLVKTGKIVLAAPKEAAADSSEQEEG
ncbi:MAG: NADH-quinone oxidoreductase subunit NuoH [bacterium]|nr:NADH-quinone oxidoreductase subunit NuoH [bacterium]